MTRMPRFVLVLSMQMPCFAGMVRPELGRAPPTSGEALSGTGVLRDATRIDDRIGRSDVWIVGSIVASGCIAVFDGVDWGGLFCGFAEHSEPFDAACVDVDDDGSEP